MEDHGVELKFKSGLKKIKPCKVKGIYFRNVSEKHRQEALSAAGSLIYGGRYNPAGVFSALYLSKTEKLCLEEIARKVGNPAFLAGRVTIRVKVELGKVLDLTKKDVLKKLGVSLAQLMSQKQHNGWDITWSIARTDYVSGQFEAILAPSAVFEGVNLVIFDKAISASTKIIE